MFSHRFFVLKKKYLILVACFLFVIASVIVYFAAIKPAFMPKAEHCIVIDAGHGGKDGGAVGQNSTESELNLQFALKLKEICEQYDFKVVLTRSDMSGLYDPFAQNKKRSEMEKRKSIIEKTDPDLVISIHMNSFPSPSARGAQVFYGQNNEPSKALAEKVQLRLHDKIEHAKMTAKEGDYFILNCTKNPSILVECGFISNSEEESLLLDKTYQQNFCYQILCGILTYFSFKN